MEGLATTQEVAAYLNIKPGTLDAWSYQGRGPRFIKIEGGRRRYDWTDVRTWVEERKVRP